MLLPVLLVVSVPEGSCDLDNICSTDGFLGNSFGLIPQFFGSLVSLPSLHLVNLLPLLMPVLRT